MSKRRKTANRQRLGLRKIAVMIVILASSLSFPVAYWLLLLSNAGHSVLEKEVALAAYGAQMQLLGILASLSPLLLIVREKVKPTPSIAGVQLAVSYASLMIVSSMGGIALSFLGIMYQWFSGFLVGFPFFFAILDVALLLLYVLGVAGFFNRLMSWAGWSFE